jgi:hypothetical protein
MQNHEFVCILQLLTACFPHMVLNIVVPVFEGELFITDLMELFINVELFIADALCQIVYLNISLVDTFAYYTKEEFHVGFVKLARVLVQGGFRPKTSKALTKDELFMNGRGQGG